MKDKDDSQTIDWVKDAERTAVFRLLYERKPTGTSPNPALNTALTKIVNVTLQDLEEDGTD